MCAPTTPLRAVNGGVVGCEPCCAAQAVLSATHHTPQHDEALTLVSLHCGPGPDTLRPETLALLHRLLGVIPAYRCVRV